MLEKSEKYRRDLHQIPELELVLPKTKQYILQALDGWIARSNHRLKVLL